MPLPYYARLSRRDKAIYRQSAEITDVPLPDARACRPLARALEEALQAGDRAEVEGAARRLVGRIAHQLQTEPVAVRVLARRPRSRTEELHGLYVREEGRPALIQVWMRTAQNDRIASFRTFLRTLLHELCHHLDYAHFALADSFHTEGFFKRESSLMRQLVPKKRGRATKASAVGKAARAPKATKAAKPEPAKRAKPGARAAAPGSRPAAPRAGRARRQLDLPF